MAIYHLKASAMTRAKGQSAVAAAAYRAGEKLYDARTGLCHDYTRKGGVVHSEILTPPGVSSWMAERALLWNGIEAVEKRKDSCVARELEVALPRELGEAARLALVRGFVGEQLSSRGIVADVALHNVRAKDGGDNPHAHILFSSRPVLKNGSGFGKKNRLLERQETLKQWRAAWGEHVNRALVEAEAGARVDHRTLAEQGIERQAEILSLAAFHMEARGGRTRQGDRCREVHVDNVRRELSRPAVTEAVREDMEEQMSAAQHRTQELLALARQALGRR
jgi:ATP-dependent exoDNAse (exonuclease V) alpha subunit